MNFAGWDADSIQGCVCDLGYTGYDCSRRTCPYGYNPLVTQTKSPEVFTLVCAATGGNFNVEILGISTFNNIIMH